MSPRRQYLLFFALVVSVIATVALVGRAPRSPSLLDTVPHDAWLVVTLDVTALRASPFASSLLGVGENTAIPAVDSLAAHCGFDPMSRLHELVVTSPESGERGDFGVAFTGDFSRYELARCAERVIRARGGSPATSARGGFTLVEDTSDTMHARLAYREGGPFLVGRGAWLDAMIDATADKAERLRSAHRELRDALARKNGARQAFVVTAVIPASVRHSISAELGPQGVGGGGPGATGVLAVTEAGLAVSFGAEAGATTTELTAEMLCESSSACADVKELLERERLTYSRDRLVRLLGLGPLVDSVTLEAHGDALSARARAPSDELARGVARIVDFTGRAPSLPAPDASGGRAH